MIGRSLSRPMVSTTRWLKAPPFVLTPMRIVGLNRSIVSIRRQDLPPRSGQYFYIFPAIGLATCVARPRQLNDACFIAAAQASADQVGPDLRAKGMLFPPARRISSRRK